MALTPCKGWLNPSYELASPNASLQKLQNMFAEVIESGDEKVVGYLRGRPGLAAALLTLPTAPLRGLLAGGAPLTSIAAGVLYAVSGSKLYEIDDTYSIVDGTNRGDVGDDGNPVQMFPNGRQLLIVSAGNAYIDNGGTATGSNATLISVSDPRSAIVNTAVITGRGLPIYQVNWVSGDQFDPSLVGETVTINSVTYTVARVYSSTSLTLTTTAGTQTGVTYTSSYSHSLSARTGAFLDSFFILALANSKTLQVSAPDDGTSWDPTDIATKESYPDNIGSILADHQELLVLGESKGEVWQAPGADPNFPFQPNESYALPMGIAAPWSLQSLRDGPVWIAASLRGLPIAYFAKGFVPSRISTHAIEQAWAAMGPAYASAIVPLCYDAFSFVFELDGHEFWVISFPIGDQTWVYDATASVQMGKAMWAEWNSYDGSAFHRFRGCCHASIFGQHLVGDFATGAIFPMSDTTYQDNGQGITYIRTLPHICVERLRQFFQKFQLDFESGGASALTITLEWSDDGGHNFVGGAAAGFQYTASTTTALDRATFWQLGSADDRVWRITITGNARVALINAYNDVLQGIS